MKQRSTRTTRNTRHSRGMSGRSRRWTSEIVSLVWIALGLWLFISLISYHPLDLPAIALSDLPHGRVNLGGRAGAWIAEFLVQTFGIAAFLLPILSLWFAYRWLRDGHFLLWLSGGLLLILAVLLGLYVMIPELSLTIQFGGREVVVPFPSGGWLGVWIGDRIGDWLGISGIIVLAVLACMIGIAILTGWHPWTGMRTGFDTIYRTVRTWWRGYTARRRVQSAHRRTTVRPSPRPAPSVSTHSAVELDRSVEIRRTDIPVEIVDRQETEERISGTATKIESVSVTPSIEPSTPPPAPEEEIDEIEWEARRWYEEIRKKHAEDTTYVLPPFQMLHPSETYSGPSSRELADIATTIQSKLAEFKIDGEIIRAVAGPVVTTFEFRPAPGVKISRVQALAEDIALALRTESVRIDRIPHASAIGIEVPNRERAVIALRRIVESEVFQNSRLPLTLALGETVHGEPYVTSLIKMPHLLIAGATGSGKSVALNCMIISILLQHTPDEVRLLLIDPKHVELKLYNGIPHLLVPVLTDTRQAAQALRWLTREMEERQRQLAMFNVRNLLQYNKVIQTRRGQRLARRLGIDDPQPLPFYVVVIDEFADLMVVSSREVEDAIQRLAQMARAVGIHLILATQRPSVDVITGVIKANFPCRIAFRVASLADSRTILDRSGAERLLGRGDMLFVPPESYRMIRLHGAFVSEAEIEKIVRFWRQQGAPMYTMRQFTELLNQATVADIEKEAFADFEDPLYDQAVQVVLKSGRTSISYLQRALRIGYNRAARLIEMMEHHGILSPPDATGQRKILIASDVTPFNEGESN